MRRPTNSKSASHELEAQIAALRARTLLPPIGIRRRATWSIAAMPLYEISLGSDPGRRQMRGHARGIIAIGDVASGVLAIGGYARGVVAIGGLATGIISIGGLSVGLVSAIGGLAIGGLALGGTAVGGVSPSAAAPPDTTPAAPRRRAGTSCRQRALRRTPARCSAGSASPASAPARKPSSPGVAAPGLCETARTTGSSPHEPDDLARQRPQRTPSTSIPPLRSSSCSATTSRSRVPSSAAASASAAPAR